MSAWSRDGYELCGSRFFSVEARAPVVLGWLDCHRFFEKTNVIGYSGVGTVADWLTVPGHVDELLWQSE